MIHRGRDEGDSTTVIDLAIEQLVERGSVPPAPLVLSYGLDHHLALPDALLQDLSPAMSDRRLEKHSDVPGH